MVDGVSYPTYFAPATNAHTIIGFCTGFKESPVSFQGKIAELNRMGFSVFGLPLPVPRPGEDFLPAYEKLVEAFFFDEKSPLYRLHPELPHLALTHSTGGLVFENHMLDEDKAEAAATLLRGAIQVAPFFDTANSSLHYHKYASMFYAHYARFYASHQLGSTYIDRIFTKLKDIPMKVEDKFLMAGAPLHGEAIILRNYGRRLQKALDDAAAQDRPFALRQAFILGNKDGAACPKTGERMARDLGAETYKIDCGHDPIHECEEGLKRVTEIAFRFAAGDNERSDGDKLRNRRHAEFLAATSPAQARLPPANDPATLPGGNWLLPGAAPQAA